jgi:hypothetical protein
MVAATGLAWVGSAPGHQREGRAEGLPRPFGPLRAGHFDRKPQPSEPRFLS